MEPKSGTNNANGRWQLGSTEHGHRLRHDRPAQLMHATSRPLIAPSSERQLQMLGLLGINKWAHDTGQLEVA